MELLNRHRDGSPLGSVYIGRGSTFGNLRVIGKDGTRAEVIQWYRGWLADKLIQRDPTVESAFKDLKEDSKLLCFCNPAPCHGAVIAEYWKEIHDFPNYEEGIKAFTVKHSGKLLDDGPTSEAYKAWLIDKLISRAPKITQDFRSLELSYDLIPEKYRDLKELPSKILVPLHRELVKSGDYDQALRSLAEKHGKMFTYTPMTDGLDHINVYSKGSTKLGRSLTNFANIGFIHPDYGHFASVEGFWYWLGSGKKHEQLRTLHGYEAKEVGRKLPKMEILNFEQEIKEAMLLKVEQCEGLREALQESTLPFTHYYYYGSVDNCKIVAHDDAKWFVDYLELIRKYLKGQAQKVIVAGSRSIIQYETVKEAYKASGFNAVEFVSGGARGVDRLGEDLANELKLPIRRFIPDWDGLGKGAGMIRNHAMGDYAGALVACWDGESKGTKDMIDYMQRLGKAAHVAK